MVGRPRKEADPRYPSRIATIEAKRNAKQQTTTSDTLPAESSAMEEPKPPGSSSTDEPIVVTQQSPATPDPESTPKSYLCEDCESPIKKGDEHCPICECKLDWSGVE